jgi:hypothetical protein
MEKTYMKKELCTLIKESEILNCTTLSNYFELSISFMLGSFGLL